MDKITEVEQVVKPVLAQNNFELIETQYRREDGRWVLRLFIDKLAASGEGQSGKVSLDDCSRMSNVSGDAIDASGVLGNAYVLEVSSPGVNRPLKTEAHFAKVVGQPVKVSLSEPLTESNIQKNFKGVLLAFHGKTIEVDDATSGRVEIPLNLIAKANLDLI